MLSFLHQTEGDAFRWEAMGDIGTGRAHLGEEMPVWMYRLAQYTMRDVLKKRLGHEGMAEAFRDAGYLAGMAFTENMLDLSLPVGGIFRRPAEGLGGEPDGRPSRRGVREGERARGADGKRGS